MKRKPLVARQTKSLFADLNLDHLEKGSLRDALRQAVGEPTVSITFRWTAGGMIEFSDLQVKYQGQWRQLLTTIVYDRSGERTFSVGHFPVTAKLTVAFKVTAFNDGIKMIVIGSQDNPLNAAQLAPATLQSKPLASGGVWEEETPPYTVKAVSFV